MNGHYEIGEVVLNDWKLVRLLGEGSYGKVYEANREDYGAVYKSAIKIITIPNSQREIATARSMGLDGESMTAYFHSFVERVAKECALMSQLKGTAHVVSYEDHRTIPHEDGMGWDIIIRMELLTPFSNYTLTHKMRQSDVIKLGMDMCQALDLCQRHNIVHRDVKPDNIFVSELGDYKLGDFGVARTMEETIGATKAGSPPYMAPEVYRQQPYNATADIYSLGLVLYRLLNEGRAPFLPPAPEQIRASDHEEAFASRISGVPIPPPKTENKLLAKVVLKACAYQPEDRYEKASQMREALKGLLQDALRSEESAVAELRKEIGDETESAAIPVLNHSYAATVAGGAVQPSADAGQKDDDPDGTVGLFGGYRVPVERADNAEDERTTAAISAVPVSPQIAGAAPSTNEKGTAEGNQQPKPVSQVKERLIHYAQDLLERLKSLPKRAKIAGVAACAALLLAIVLAVSLGGEKGTPDARGKEDAPDGESVPASTQTSGTEPVVKELVWSDWMDHLPADISGENSAIQCKLQYRSAPLHRIEDGSPQEEGYTVLRTEYGAGYGNYTWRSSPISENESIEVAVSKKYQYKRKVEFVPPKAGLYIIPEPTYETYWTSTWEGTPLATSSQYGSRPRHRIDYCYSADEWGEFTDEPLLPNDETVVNTRMVYCYAETGNGQVATNRSMENFPVFSADYTGRFADVDDAIAWYGAQKSDVLRTVCELGILLPDSNMRFHPDDPVTVGQAIRAAVMIQRIYQGRAALLGENNGQYQSYVSYAEENGIIARGEFVDLSKSVTRQELAYILFGSLPAEELQGYLTIGAISDMDSRFYDYALGLAKAGVVSLGSGNVFRPGDAASRAETASMIDRLIYPEHRVGRNS